jgi:anaerobic selenocysteine-containing dehydrogenase
MTPALQRAFAERMRRLYGIGTEAGLDTYASMAAASEGRIRAACLLGGNLFASNPDRAWAGAALRRIGTTIGITTKLNEGHVHGRGQVSILLPVLARDEEPQATTQESMFNFVRLSEGGRPAVPGEMRSEVEVIASLAERILPPGRFDWSALRSHARLREEIARAVPGFEEIGSIDETGREFQISGRTFHEPVFATSDGRARFHVTPVPGEEPSGPGVPGAPGEPLFRLTTIRSEGQFNTVVYEEEDLYRGNLRRDVVMMAAADARALGLVEGSRVEVETAAGAMRARAAIIDIRPGNLAMYYPEANRIVPRRLDPRSGTPSFKSIPARVRPVGPAASPDRRVSGRRSGRDPIPARADRA